MNKSSILEEDCPKHLINFLETTSAEILEKYIVKIKRYKNTKRYFTDPRRFILVLCNNCSVLKLLRKICLNRFENNCLWCYTCENWFYTCQKCRAIAIPVRFNCRDCVRVNADVFAKKLSARSSAFPMFPDSD